MAIIGSAEVEVRADVRKLGRDITDSFSDLSKNADEVADKMGKSIGDSLKKNLDGLTIKINLDDSILDEIIEIEEQIDRLSNQKIKINLDDSDMDKVNTYHGKTLRYDIDLDTTYLDAQLKKLTDQKIDLKVNDKSLKKEATKSVERAISGIPDTSLRVPVTPDVDDSGRNFLSQKLIEAMEGAQKVAQKHAEPINFSADTSEIMEHLEMLRDFEVDDIEMGITLDSSDLEEINAAIESLRAYNESNAIDLEVELHAAKVWAELALLSRKRFVDLTVRLNTKAVTIAQGTLAGFTGFNIMKDHTKDFIETLTELDKQLPQTALLLTGLSAAVPAAGWGAGVLSMLIGDLAALSGVLVPGSALLVAYSAGMQFLNNAFSKPHKQKFIPEITKQLQDFAEAVAGDFWGVAKPSYNTFAFKTLPAVYSAAKGVNLGMASLASSFWDSIGAVIKTDRGLANLTTTSENIEAGMYNLSGAFEPVMQALLTFVRVGSQYLPDLGTHVTNLAEKFDSWMQSMDESGALEDWAEVGINTLKELGSIIASTVGIFYSLYKIADSIGFPGLTEMADGLSKINESLKTEGTVTALTRLGTATKDAFNTMAGSLSWVGGVFRDNFDGIINTIGVMGDIVAEILGGIGDAFTNTNLVPSFLSLFDSMRIGAEAFRPAMESIGTIMAVTFDFLGSAIENITPILTQFFQNLENDAVLIKPALMGILDIFGEWGPQVMEVVGHVTNGIAEWFGNLNPVIALAGIAFVGLGGVISGLGVAAVGAIAWVGKFGDDIGRLAGVFGKTIPEGQLLQTLLGGLRGAFPAVAKAVGFLTGPIGWIVGAFVSAFVASKDLRQAVGDFLVNAFKTLAAFVQPLIGPLGSLFSTIMGGLDQVASAVAPAFTGLFNALNSIMPVLQLVARFLGAVLGGAIKSLSTQLGSIFNTISTVVGGLANIIGGAFNTIASLVTGVIGIIKGLVSGDMSAVADAAKNMWDGLKEAWGQMFSGAIQAVVGVVTGAADLVLSALKGMFEQALHVLDTFDLAPQAQAIIQSLIDGFSGAIDGVRQFLQDLTQWIIDWKGPPSTDATLLNDAGRSIIQSLIDGFISAVDAVFTFLQGLTQSIVDVVMNVVNAVVGFFQTGWSVLVTVVQTVWSLIVTVIQTVLTTVFTVVQTYVNLVVTIFQTGWTILTTVVQTVWSLIVTVIQTVLTTVLTVVQTYVNLVVTFIQTGWSLLTTIVQGVWTGIQTVIQGAWLMIQTIIQTALSVVVTIVQTIFTTVLTIVITVWNTIRNAISVAVNAVRTVISTVMTGIITIVSTIWNTIRTVTMTVWNTIKALISLGLAAIKALFTGNFAAFRTIITTAWNLIRSTTQSVWNTIRSAISSVLNTIRSVVQSVFNTIRSTITSIMNGIRSTIQSVWSAIRSAITSAVNTIRSTITSGFNAARSIITSVMNAARSIISSVWSSIRSTISSAVSSVRSTVSSGFNALRGIVSSAWNAVVSAVSSAIARMMSLVTSIPGKIRGALGNLGSLLTGAGKSIIQGLINGVSGMVGTLKNKFSSITNMIPDWKGPPDTDAKLLTNAGELIMEGLINGLESRYGAVKNSLQTFTGDLSQTVGTQIGADVGLTTSVRETALSDAERRLSYRSGADSMVQSDGTGEVHIHFHQALVNQDEIIMAVNRELGRG